MENINKDINEDFIKQAECESRKYFAEDPSLLQERNPVNATVRRHDLIEMLANNKAVPVKLMKEHMGEASHIRLEALRLATEVALKINHFEHQYQNIEALLQDIDLVHAIADHNFKYLMGEK